MSEKRFNVGERVAWSSSQDKIVGKIKAKLTAPAEIKGHHVAAAPDNPEYLVESDATGALAAHKPRSLERRP